MAPHDFHEVLYYYNKGGFTLKKNVFYSSLLLSALFLTACNTTAEEVPKTTASSEQPTNETQSIEPAQPVEQVSPVEQQPAPVVEEPRTKEPVVESPVVVASAPKKSLITAASTALSYTIQHPEDYTLIEEEPGKDMLFYSENDALSMRIEVMNTADTSFDMMNEATQQSMAAIAPNNTYESFNLTPYLDAANRTDIKTSASYIVQYESDKVTAIVYEIENKVVVLTIFDDYITGITDAFITAGLTIK